MATKAKSLIKKETETMAAYAADAGDGFENTTQDDYAIPFLTILQDLSPACKRKGGVPGAEPGGIINTVTKELFPGAEGIRFIPVAPLHTFVEWQPREQGGGFVGVHEPESQVVLDAKSRAISFGKYTSETGNDLVDTFSLYGILLKDDGAVEQLIISFKSAGIKKYKQLMTRARNVQIQLPDGRAITPPLYGHVYRFKTMEEVSAQGAYFNWDISFDGANAEACRILPGDGSYLLAKKFKGLMSAGKTRAQYETDEPVI